MVIVTKTWSVASLTGSEELGATVGGGGGAETVVVKRGTGGGVLGIELMVVTGNC